MGFVGATRSAAGRRTLGHLQLPAMQATVDGAYTTATSQPLGIPEKPYFQRLPVAGTKLADT
jgi:hypothetical protein